MRLWIQKVGPVEDTMHWSSTGFYQCISNMYKMDPSALCDQFVFGSSLDSEAKGVMDVLFAAGCFNTPVVELMGSLFWVFAKELIRLYVSDVDFFNLLIWGQPLPQTVLVLAPVVFSLDCMLPGVESVISIEGTVNKDEKTGEETSESVSRSTIMVPGNTCMVFFNSVRMSGLDICRFLVPYAPQCERAINITGRVPAGKTVRFVDVDMTGGGLSITNIDSVCCLGLSIRDAKTGVSVKHVEEFFFGSGGRYIPVLTNCELAFSLAGLSKASFEEAEFRDSHVVFHARVTNLFEVKRVAVTKCTSMGQVLMNPGNAPMFYRVMVRLIVSFLLF